VQAVRRGLQVTARTTADGLRPRTTSGGVGSAPEVDMPWLQSPITGALCTTVFIAVGCASSDSGKSPTTGLDSAPQDTGAPPYDPSQSLAANCWSDINSAAAGFPDYEALGMVPGSCSGSSHQSIGTVERLVFLGDSVTAGTPPTLEDDVYRAVLTRAMQERFGEGLIVDNCSKFGARTDDFLPSQIPECFPDVEDRHTLVVATNGGNDLFAAAEVVLEGGSEEDGLAVLERAVEHHRAAAMWFKDNPELFPGGVAVVLANVYEFTDTTGHLSGCDLADGLGFGGQVDAVVEATQYLNGAYAEVAVATGTDMLFMNENFCGHGFGRLEADGACYRGADAELWFDPTCIHPSTEGHAAISAMFAEVVDVARGAR